jgi:prophage regulatory protein
MIAAKQSKADTEEVAPDKPEPRRMLNEAQVLALIPVSRTTPHRMAKTGALPQRHVCANRRLWFADEIIAWQNAVDEFDPNRGRGKWRRHRVA